MEIHRPETLAHALEVKAENPDAMPLASGTDLMAAINFRQTRPPAVLDLTAVEELASGRPTTGACASAPGSPTRA